ncbi:hypothetical protein LFE01_11900 [Limosilactobacillus fermentum]|nr:hypothetical protein LFE01_11900 [Limosilactobacillus fermentum]
MAGWVILTCGVWARINGAPFALEAPLVVETFYLFLGVDMDGISREIFPDAVHYAIH